MGEKNNNSYPVLKTVSGSDIISNIAKNQNREIVELPVGFKYIAKKMVNEKIFIGGEESGGVGFGEFMPERDALYAAMILLNGIAENDTPDPSLSYNITEDNILIANNEIEYSDLFLNNNGEDESILNYQVYNSPFSTFGSF